MVRATQDVLNDRTDAVTKFCLAMEQFRRVDAGRVRTAKEMLDFFFPRDSTGNVNEDRVFVHMPPDVRGPVISGWGVRGAKSAVRDTNEKIRQVVQDALAAGDIDEANFEEGLSAQILIDWIPLTDWWNFWRNGKLTGVAVQKALATARDLGLFDDRWFLLNVDGRGGKLKGTDTLCDTLSKDQIVAWIRKVHESGDGSPAGLIGALSWETILAKTSQEALLFAVDALAKKLLLDIAAGGATEAPARPPENIAVPEIPGLDPPPGATGDVTPTSEAGPVPTWSDVPSTDPSPSEPPPSFRLIDEKGGSKDIQSKAKPPPPVPGRKR